MKKGKGYQLQFSRQQGVDRRGGGGGGTGILIGEGGGVGEIEFKRGLFIIP